MYINTKYKITRYKSTAGQLNEDRAFCGILQKERQTEGTTNTKKNTKYNSKNNKVQNTKVQNAKVQQGNLKRTPHSVAFCKEKDKRREPQPQNKMKNTICKNTNIRR